MSIGVGVEIPPWTLETVSAEKMKTLAAILRDPNPIHWDNEEVRKRGLGEGVINQGPTNLGYVMNMLMAWAGQDRLERIKVRFNATVHEGDTVTAGGVVTAIDERSGTADCEVWLDRGDGTRALAGTATVSIEGLRSS